eukprot:281737-Pyramimonas_sp.AAC.2
MVSTNEPKKLLVSSPASSATNPRRYATKQYRAEYMFLCAHQPNMKTGSSARLTIVDVHMMSSAGRMRPNPLKPASENQNK